MTDARAAFVDRFAAVMRDSGIPPMPSAVFAHVLADGRTEYTAAELAASVGVSPAAISGAVNYLLGVGMLERARRPGDRRNYYRLVPGDPWAAMIERRQPVIVQWYESLAEAARDLHEASEGNRHTLELGAMFFAFMAQEAPAMIERWKTYRDAQLSADARS